MIRISDSRAEKLAGVAAFNSLGRLGLSLRIKAAKFRAWRVRRAASRYLHSAEDAMLKDIGLHRSEIDSALLELDRRRWGGKS